MSPVRDAAHFNELYAANSDPWNFATSPYEAQKYSATLASLAGRRFNNALEVGCSIGVLTAQLATLCDQLLAIDIASAPLASARARNPSANHVVFEQRAVPAQWPAGSFDLIILSEVLYFLDASEIDRTADLARVSLAPGGVVLLVNYLGPINEPLSGEQAAQRFRARFGEAVHASHREPRFLIDRLG